MTDDTNATQTNTSARFGPDAVRTALEVAVRAPSIHNTQPWRWRLDDDGLLLLADRTRQLAIADPDAHSLLISCGAALHLTELALRAAGWRFDTTYLPEATEPDMLARIRPIGRVEVTEEPAAEVAAALDRRSDRRPFADKQITAEDRERLRTVSNDFAYVDFPNSPDRYVELAVAVSWADRAERNDVAYLAEMRRWLRDPDVHTLLDGVPVDAIPHVPADAPRHTDVPLRDFEIGVTGQQLIQRDVDERPLIAVIFTRSDHARDYLHAGIAMMRLMLRANLLGLSTCALSQAVDFAAFRARLQTHMGWVDYPQMMLRIGYPSAPLSDLPLTPRRAPAAVLDTAALG